MIKFTKVTGEVLVDGKKGTASVAAYKGMTIEKPDCVIRASKGGRATVDVRGTRVQLKPYSFIRIRPDGSSFRQKVEPGFFRRNAGKIWSKIERGDSGRWEREMLTEGNAVIGVRG